MTATRPPGGRRLLRAGAAAVAVVCAVVLLLLAVVSRTALDAGFYEQALEEARVYERIYTEVLADPALQPVTADLVAGLPVDESILTANLAVVLPPTVLRATTSEVLDQALGWLRGERDRPDLDVALAPVVANLSSLARIYAANTLVGAVVVVEDDPERFRTALDDLLAALAAGEAVASVPAAGPDVDLVGAALETIESRAGPIPEPRRSELALLLRDGRLVDALSLVVDGLVDDRAGAAADRLRARAGGAEWDLSTALAPVAEHRTVDVARSVRRVVLVALGPIRAVAVVLLAAAGAAAILLTPPGRRLRVAATLAGVALATGVVAWLLVRAALPAPLRSLAADADTAPSVGALAGDVSARLDAGVRLVFWRTTGVAALVAGVALGTAAAAVAVGRDRAVARRWWAPVGGSAVVVVLVVGAVGATAPVRVPACNGHPALCARGYDEVTVLGSHNSMAATETAFLGPHHDSSMLRQLDLGVRALFVDAHRWLSTDEALARLAALGDETSSPTTLAPASGARPGIWLCHNLCALGATALADFLDELAAWLDDHPREVVTLVVQDEVPVQELVDAFEASGLVDRIAVPPDGPDRPWPTLGAMVRGRRTLVVFTEAGRSGEPWLRNVYDLAMETPYRHDSPESMSCAPNRGGTGRRLFLVNHWITRGTASRPDSAVLNGRDFLVERATRCEAERGRRPTWISVDFVEIGAATAAVDALNGVGR